MSKITTKDRHGALTSSPARHLSKINDQEIQDLTKDSKDRHGASTSSSARRLPRINDQEIQDLTKDSEDSALTSSPARHLPKTNNQKIQDLTKDTEDRHGASIARHLLKTNNQEIQNLSKDSEDRQFSASTTSLAHHLSRINDQDLDSTALIGPFKNKLELALYLTKQLDIINLTLSMMKASGQESSITQIINEKSDKLKAFSERVNSII